MAIVADAISRVRNVLKAVKEDPFMTDRFIYSLIMKYGKTLMYRDSKTVNLFKNSGLFREIPCIDLIEVSAIDACCSGIKTSCTFRRSKDKLPALVKLDDGPVIRAVTTLDYSQRLNKTEPSTYVNITRSTGFKYNNNRYYWIINDYLFVPNVEWEAVRMQAMFEEDINKFLCTVGEDNICTPEQEREIAIPEHLFTEIENMIRQEMFGSLQIPAEGPDDQQSLLR